MSNITIFGEPSNLPTVRRESKLLSQRKTSSLRRIATNTNGTFKRIVNGEQIGKAIPHEINVIIISHLDQVSRQLYIKDYDPKAKPTLPDCWSNLGDKPDAKAPNPQSTSCDGCPNNVKGSGKNGKGKACRYNRRLAVMAEGDPSSDVYQLSVAGGSLFGDGADDVYPFEGYRNFLEANGEGTDTVVTKVMYDLDADTMTLRFKPIRHLTQEECDMVDAAQADPETQKYVALTVAQADGVKEASASETPTPKTIVAPAPKAKPVNPFADDEEEEQDEAPAQPVKRTTKKETAPTTKKPLAAVLSAWGEED
jgi:hypothetical protein